MKFNGFGDLILGDGRVIRRGDVIELPVGHPALCHMEPLDAPQ